MKQKILKSVVVTISLLLSGQSLAGIVYDINRVVGGATVVGTVTTDGTIGVLDDGNITGFSLTLDDGTYTVPITDANGGTHFVSSGTAFPGATVGSPLSATATQLLFDFSSTGFIHFQLNPVDTGTPFWCLTGTASSSHCVGTTGAELVKTNQSPPVSYSTPYTANDTAVVVGTLATVPEPTVLGLLGLGLLGLSLSRRNKA